MKGLVARSREPEKVIFFCLGRRRVFGMRGGQMVTKMRENGLTKRMRTGGVESRGCNVANAGVSSFQLFVICFV